MNNSRVTVVFEDKNKKISMEMDADIYGKNLENILKYGPSGIHRAPQPQQQHRPQLQEKRIQTIAPGVQKLHHILKISYKVS